MLVGIDGATGSGKSTLIKKMLTLSDHFYHLQTDEIAFYVLSNKAFQKKAIELLGLSIVNNDDSLNKKVIGTLIFNNKDLYDKYNHLASYFMYELIDKIIQEKQEKIILLDWSLLSISKYYSMCDYKILLVTPYEIRKKRVIERDKIEESYFDLKERVALKFDFTKYDLIIDGEDISYEFIMNIATKLIKLKENIV